MRVISLLCSIVLLVACSSSPSSGASAPEDTESKYSQGLPATDFGAESSPVAAQPSASGTGSSETGYSRQFVLEEEVVASVRASDASRSRNSEEFQVPAANDLAAVERQSLPPLDQTFTLQLAAVKDMQQAIEYAERYNIDAEQAGVTRILSKGQLWYVLAYGVYTSREHANLAKEDLEAHGVPSPWIRSLATLEALNKEAVRDGY